MAYCMSADSKLEGGREAENKVMKRLSDFHGKREFVSDDLVLSLLWEAPRDKQ